MLKQTATALKIKLQPSWRPATLVIDETAWLLRDHPTALHTEHRTIRDESPQNSVEKILRLRIYSNICWKEHLLWPHWYRGTAATPPPTSASKNSVAHTSTRCGLARQDNWVAALYMCTSARRLGGQKAVAYRQPACTNAPTYLVAVHCMRQFGMQYPSSLDDTLVDKATQLTEAGGT
eukprot:TRINITY_DN4830_c0_g1_i2.p1 TRINITY_DN4830_c0_g1~~TRINITY_DN4830_c0_g1_i2.p1  ORF type:complete len:178 (+),score=20.35 TRINITY_DN4830_c0_g1_i2:415-948(+)